MYLILRSLLYVLSLIPWKIMYGLSFLLYVWIYYVTGYRKKVVMANLLIAFPEKTEPERVVIAKRFYRQLTDSFFEIIKLFSISKQQLSKRISSNAADLSMKKDQNICFVTAHFFNWEFANLGGVFISPLPVVLVYMPVSIKPLDRLMKEMRSKMGSILIPAPLFSRQYIQHARQNHALVLAGDQSPANPDNAYWVNFFGKLTPFIKGPEKIARSMRPRMFFINIYRVKRGYYHFHHEEIFPAQHTTEGSITRELVRLTEEAIKQRPENYLWSHRRWKHSFDANKHTAVD